MSEILRALSVRQPWAAAIAHYGKNIENRTRRTHHRGLIAVHASLEPAADADHALQWIREVADSTPRQVLSHDVRGVIIAVAEIVGCHEAGDTEHCIEDGGCSPWARPAGWHWELDNVRPLPHPVGARGALGLWRLPTEPYDVDSAVREQLGELGMNSDYGRQGGAS
jgi:hypothetical protein